MHISHSCVFICRASLPSCVFSRRAAFPSVPCFFSVEDCQGLSLHNSLYTLCSHHSHEEEEESEESGRGGMMSPSTNNNHPASELSSMSLGFLATPWLSHQPLALCKPFAFPSDCNGSNHCTGTSSLTAFLSYTPSQLPNNFIGSSRCHSVPIVSPLFAASGGKKGAGLGFVFFFTN